MESTGLAAVLFGGVISDTNELFPGSCNVFKTSLLRQGQVRF